MHRVAFAVVVVGVLVTGCGSSPHRDSTATHSTGSGPSRSESIAARTSTDRPRAAGSKYVVLDGVRLTIPAAWPIIDGAHARDTCSSRFTGQADRAFVGLSYQSAPSCPAPARGTTPPRADGVWMQPAQGAPPSLKPTTLPAGQTIYLSTDARAAAVTVWYHRVMIQIGIGANPAVGKSILNSVTFSPATHDTAVLGRCPAPAPSPPSMPVPTRLTAPLSLGDHNATLRPEPAGIRPGVSAATVWTDLFHNFGAAGFAGPLRWSITFGSYSAQTPATIHRDGSETPLYRDVATWLIHGQGVSTSYGLCGITVYAPYNATTGRSMGVETTG